MDKVLGVWLEEELIKSFKVYCAKNDVSMESVVREAIQERIKNEFIKTSPKRTK